MSARLCRSPGSTAAARGRQKRRQDQASHAASILKAGQPKVSSGGCIQGMHLGLAVHRGAATPPAGQLPRQSCGTAAACAAAASPGTTPRKPPPTRQARQGAQQQIYGGTEMEGGKPSMHGPWAVFPCCQGTRAQRQCEPHLSCLHPRPLGNCQQLQRQRHQPCIVPSRRLQHIDCFLHGGQQWGRGQAGGAAGCTRAVATRLHLSQPRILHARAILCPLAFRRPFLPLPRRQACASSQGPLAPRCGRHRKQRCLCCRLGGRGTFGIAVAAAAAGGAESRQWAWLGRSLPQHASDSRCCGRGSAGRDVPQPAAARRLAGVEEGGCLQQLPAPPTGRRRELESGFDQKGQQLCSLALPVCSTGKKRKQAGPLSSLPQVRSHAQLGCRHPLASARRPLQCAGHGRCVQRVCRQLAPRAGLHAERRARPEELHVESRQEVSGAGPSHQ